MIKAVFIDYTGTIITQGGKDLEEFIQRVNHSSDMKNPKEFMRYWWGMVKEFEASSNEDGYITEDEMVDKMLDRCVREIHLEENLDELHVLCQRFWMYAPLFEDVKDFFGSCPYPIYIISNNGKKYVDEAMKTNGIAPAGIVTADLVKAKKPHPAIFQKALEISGCTADEAVHIGDSVVSDVNGAKAVGITPVLLDREGKAETSDVLTARSLSEVMELLQTAL